MNKMNLLNETLLLPAARLSQPDSWCGHIPFGMWLLEGIRPQILVELGTHTGNSYFSFCQSVQKNDLSTHCYAIDTWEGDSQAGYYGDDVFSDVAHYNDEHYSAFSRLLRMTFDEAHAKFNPESIDLLHIDGLHTYEAVRHDFETWLPKLSQRAVVLLHDINVRDGDFEVWRLWDELKAQYPNIQFEHSNGLGVLFVGKQLAKFSQDLLHHWQQPSWQQKTRNLFERLGQTPRMSLQIQRLIKSNEEYNLLVHDLQKEISRLIQQVKDNIQFIDHLKLSVEEFEKKIKDQLNEKLKLGNLLAQKKQEQLSHERTIFYLTQERDALLASTSWRLTSPLRKGVNAFRFINDRERKLSRSLFYKLPLSPAQRNRLKACFYRRGSMTRTVFSSKDKKKVIFSSAATQKAMDSALVRILLVERSVPRPNQDAGSVMIFNFVRIFRSRGYAVSFLPVDLGYDPEYTPALEALGVECLHAPDVCSIEDHLTTSGTKYNIIFTCRPDHTDAILHLFKKYCRAARLLYETHDLHFVREQRQAEIEKSPKLCEQAKWRKAQELRIAAAVDCTVVVSEQERQLLIAEDPELYVEVIPVIGDVHGNNTSYEQRKDLVFIGGYEHKPNVDAVLYFVKEILPHIHEEIPDIRFHVVGSHPPKEIMALASETVIIHGFVPDITTIMNDVRISVNPLRFGAGVKGKLITCMSYGIPCVGTEIAVEGMNLIHDKHALVAADALSFANAVVRLYSDHALWTELSNNGISFVRTNFSLDVADGVFDRIFKKLLDNESDKLQMFRFVSRADCHQQGHALPPEETSPKAGFCFVCQAEVDFESRPLSSTNNHQVPMQTQSNQTFCSQCGFDTDSLAAIHLFHQRCSPRIDSRILLIGGNTEVVEWFATQYNNLGLCRTSKDEVVNGQLPYEYILCLDPDHNQPCYQSIFQDVTRYLSDGGSMCVVLSPADSHISTVSLEKKLKPVSTTLGVSAEIAIAPSSEEDCPFCAHRAWEMIDCMRAQGFSDVAAYQCRAEYFGYQNNAQLLVYGVKRGKN